MRSVRLSKNSCCVREHWCRAGTDNARSSWDIPSGRAIVAHFSHQHMFDIAWTSGRKELLFSLNSTIAQKGSCRLVHRNVGKNTMAVLQKTFIWSSQVTNHGSVRMSPKQNKSPPCGSSKTCQIQRKLFMEEALRSRWSPVSSAKRSILNGTSQFLWRNSKNEQEMTNHCSQWQFEFSYIGSNQLLFDRPKRPIDGSTLAQPWLGTQWLFFKSM